MNPNQYKFETKLFIQHRSTIMLGEYVYATDEHKYLRPIFTLLIMLHVVEWKRSNTWKIKSKLAAWISVSQYHLLTVCGFICIFYRPFGATSKLFHYYYYKLTMLRRPMKLKRFPVVHQI